jgi:hypothetical protein
MKVISLITAVIVLTVSIAANYRDSQLKELFAAPLIYAAGLHMFYAYLTGTTMYSSGFISKNSEDNPASRAILGWIGIFVSSFVIYLLWSGNAQHT